MQRKRGRWHNRLMAFGTIGIFVIMEASAATAQFAKPILTLRPREMATATQTARAGQQTTDGQPLAHDSLRFRVGTVYVPQQCVGARRCPLLMYNNAPSKAIFAMADKYGMIIHNSPFDETDSSGAVRLDRELQQILRTFAIDPDKIAILGRCSTGQQAVDYAASNPYVFSRVIVGTHHDSDPQVKAPNQTTEYLLATGILDGIPSMAANFAAVRRLRDRGYTVTNSLQFRAHAHTLEEYDFMGRWLQQSWAIPNPAARPVPPTFSSPPLLTAGAVAQLTTFWNQFMKEPDSIRHIARRALVREVLIPLGEEHFSTLMIDMPALAARYPSVAAVLRAAKLMPQQHEAYQAALASAYVYRTQLNRFSSEDSMRAFLGIKSTAAVVKNFEFLRAHPDQFQMLEETDLWRPEDVGSWFPEK